MQFSALLAGLVFLLFLEAVHSLSLQKRRPPLITVPVTRRQPRHDDVHPQIWLQMQINRNIHRLAKMSGVDPPSLQNLEQRLVRRILSVEGPSGLHRRLNRLGSMNKEKRFNRFGHSDLESKSGLSAVSFDSGNNQGSSSNSGIAVANTPTTANSLGLNILGDDVTYLATMQIGSPLRNFSVIMDSGSADFWVGGESCQITSNPGAQNEENEEQGGGQYDPNGDGGRKGHRGHSTCEDESPYGDWCPTGTGNSCPYQDGCPTTCPFDDGCPTGTGDTPPTPTEGYPPIPTEGYPPIPTGGDPPIPTGGGPPIPTGGGDGGGNNGGGGGCGAGLGKQSSSSFQETGKTFVVNYESGDVSGDMVQDTLVIAGLKLPNHNFGVTTEETKDFEGVDGLMGLAKSSISNQKVATPVEALAADNLIRAAIVSYKLDRTSSHVNEGEITFGGLDTSKFDSKTLVTLDNDNPRGFWEAKLDGVSVNGDDLGIGSISTVLDTGTTLMYVDSQSATAIHSRISGSNPDGQGGFTIPCNTNATLTLTYAGKPFTIAPQDLAFQPSGDNQCISGIASNDDPAGEGSTHWLVGDTFLKNVYFSTDVTNNKLSLAKLV